MTKSNVSTKPSRTYKRSKNVDASDPQELQKRLIAIDQVLRMRFREYSHDVEALAPLSSILDTKTLDDLFAKAWRENTFGDFCRAVSQTWKKYSAFTESEKDAPRIVIANAFNNHVATTLGKRGKITAQFLRMCVRRISPELAKQLDFRRAKSEPTVFVFGNNVSRICDMLFTIPYKDGRKEFFPIIVLMEHKSTPDRNVVQQMLTSLVATLDFAKRYPERFKTPEGKTIWPFVVLFYTGVQQWNEVRNLPDLFTTSLKELDQDWIFNLRFLLVSLVEKRIEVVPTIPGKKIPPTTFDKALCSVDMLAFFFDFLLRAEITNNDPNATREGWLSDVCESLRILKRVYRPTSKHDAAVLDDALSLVGTICAKKNFVMPTRDELTSILEKEGVGGMARTTWLLSDEEREAARSDGEIKGRKEGMKEGRKEGKKEGKLDILAQMIGLRFPKATPAFIKKALKPFSDSYATELMTAVINTDSLEEFKKRISALAPGC